MLAKSSFGGRSWFKVCRQINYPYMPMWDFPFVVLLLWILVVRILPKTLAGLSWIILFAILLTNHFPWHPPDIAPASISVVYGFYSKIQQLSLMGCYQLWLSLQWAVFLGFIWQILRMGIDKTNKNIR